MSEAITLVTLAHEQYRLAIDEMERKRNGYITAIEYAREQGESYATIGNAVGISRQRVFRLLNGE